MNQEDIQGILLVFKAVVKKNKRCGAVWSRKPKGRGMEDFRSPNLCFVWQLWKPGGGWELGKLTPFTQAHS